MHHKTRFYPSLFHGILLAAALFFSEILYGQITLNGSFEYLTAHEKPAPWTYQKDSFYTVHVSNSESFHGKRSLHIRPTKASRLSSFVFYQAMDLTPYKGYRQIEVNLKLKFNTSDSTCFIPYVGMFKCDPQIEARGEIRANVDSIKWTGAFKRNEWLPYTIRIRPKTYSCKDLYFGFVLRGNNELFVDAVEVLIDGKKIDDRPLVNPPLPGKYEMTWLKKHVITLKSTEDTENLNDLSFLRAEIGDAEVVALGESTHGAYEFNTLRHRIIRFLVEQMHFTVIAFENDMIYSFETFRQLRDTFSSQKLLETNFPLIHRTKEIAALLDYARNMNTTGKHPVYLEGFDNRYPVAVLTWLKNNLSGIDSALWALVPEITYQQWYAHSRKAGYVDSLLQISKNMLDVFDARRKTIENRLGSDSVLRIGKYVELFYQSLALSQDYGRLTMFNPYSGFRDSIMAENLLWLRKRYPGQKIIVWAHNGHIHKGASDYLPARWQASGGYLKKALGNKYKSYAFHTARGQSTFYSEQGRPGVWDLEEPTAGCYEYYLDKLHKPALYLPLPSSEKEINKLRLLFKGLRWRNMGHAFFYNQFYPFEMAGQFDGIFFISRTRAARSFLLPGE